jgi:hypothetical protein
MKAVSTEEVRNLQKFIELQRSLNYYLCSSGDVDSKDKANKILLEMRKIVSGCVATVDKLLGTPRDL